MSFDLTQQADAVSEKPLSEPTAQLIDQEVRLLIDAAFQRTLWLVTEKKEMVEKVRTVVMTKTLEKSQDPDPNQMTELCGAATDNSFAVCLN